GQAADADFDPARAKLHIAQLQRVIVTDSAVGKLDVERAALVLDGKVEPGALAEGEEHRQPDRAPQAEIDEGARAEQRLADRRRDPARLFGRGIVERAIVDQSARPADLRHHAVAGVDAQRAGDAADLRSLADVDAGRADRDALIAIDAVA